MIRNYRRADKNKRDEIRRVRQYFIDAGIPEDEVFFAQVKKVPDATAREHEWAIDFAGLGGSPPDENWMKIYREKKRQFNKSDRNPDEEIIGVPTMMIDVHGKKRIIWLEKIAEGDAAKMMAVWCEKPRDGYNAKIKRLHRMSRDHKIKVKHDIHMREIEKRARRK